MGRMHADAMRGAGAGASARTHRVGGAGGKAEVRDVKCSLYSALMEAGVAVANCSHHYDAWRAALLAELDDLGPKVLWPAAGGFGAIGAPCMAASPVGYTIDRAFYKQIQAVLQEAVEERGGAEAINTAYARIAHDRFGIRPKAGWITYDGETMVRSIVPNEGAHRDVSTAPLDTMTFGGFVNLGPRDQFFSCVPGTGYGFRQTATNKNGFTPMSAEESIAMRKRMKVYRVPPGHAIIFDSTIAHCVADTKATRNPPVDTEAAGATQIAEGNLRKYVSWWMTVSTTTEAATPDKSLDPWGKLQAGRPPRIPSGQDQLFVPKNWSLHPARQLAYEAQFDGKYKGRVPVDNTLKDYPKEWRAVYEVEVKEEEEEEEGAGA